MKSSNNKKSGDIPPSSELYTPRDRLRNPRLIASSKGVSNYLHEKGMIRRNPLSIKELLEVKDGIN